MVTIVVPPPAVLVPGLDDLSERDGLADDGAEDGRGDTRIVEALLREIERGARPHDRRGGVRVVEVRRLVLLRRDDLPREEVVRALLLELGHFKALRRRVEVGLRLVVLVLHVARIELDDEVARPDERAGLDRHLDDLSRRAGLHLDDVDRLDDAGRLGLHDDRAALDGRGADGERRLLLAGTVDRQGDERDEGKERQELAGHGRNSDGVREGGATGWTPERTERPCGPRDPGRRAPRAAPWRYGHRGGPG
jgi:hypothetical protein